MAKNIEKIAAGLGERWSARCLIPEVVRSVPHGSLISSQPCKPALSLDKDSVQAGQPMQAGYGILRCR